MGVGLTLIAVVAGIATILGLWLYSPVLAIICAPLAASVVTALAAVMSLSSRSYRRRSRLGLSSPSYRQAH